MTPVPIQDLTPAELDAALRLRGFDRATNEPIRGQSGAPVPEELVGPARAALAVQRAGELVATARGNGTDADPEKVTLNDSWVAGQGGVGVAWFTPHREPRVSLGPGLTQDLVAGMAHLAHEPFSAWTASDRHRFARAGHVVLHEALHIALPEHTSTAIEGALGEGPRRTLDEALTEHSTRTLLPEYLRTAFGVELSEEDAQLLVATGAYTGEVARLDALLDLAGTQDDAVRAAMVGELGDTLDPTRRGPALADAVIAATGAAEPMLPEWVRPYLAEQAPRFVAELPGTMIGEIVATMRDAGAGQPVDWDALKRRVAEMARFREPPGAPDADDTTG